MRFYSTTGCYREDCPSADTNSAHIVKETDQSKDEELGEREGEFQNIHGEKILNVGQRIEEHPTNARQHKQDTTYTRNNIVSKMTC